MNLKLDQYNNINFNRGRPIWTEALWLLVQAFFISSWIPGSFHRKMLLKLFGAKIGRNVTIKPYVKIKFPWRLSIGDHSWIGEAVWIDNLASVTLGNHCCISQDVYLCTGNHDWSKKTFDLITEPIEIGDYSWLGAKSVVCPGVKIEEGAVLGIGTVATKHINAWWIHQGNPAKALKKRLVK